MIRTGFGIGWAVAIAAIAAIAWLVWVSQDSRIQKESAELIKSPTSPLRQISALGRLEPRGSVIRLAGPPRIAVVIKKLRVMEGDYVENGQIVAIVQGIDVQRADVNRFRAELKAAERELKRRLSLGQEGHLAETELEVVKLRVEMARASLDRAEADLKLSIVRSPIDGRVLNVHAREGERVNEKGIAELGDTSRMYTIAEVYETDIRRVKVGQKANITSAALPGVLIGRVERIGLLIGKKDILKTDPVADADARVVEVDIRMDDSESVAGLTNLRVDVVIEREGEQ